MGIYIFKYKHQPRSALSNHYIVQSRPIPERRFPSYVTIRRGSLDNTRRKNHEEWERIKKREKSKKKISELLYKNIILVRDKVTYLDNSSVTLTTNVMPCGQIFFYKFAFNSCSWHQLNSSEYIIASISIDRCHLCEESFSPFLPLARLRSYLLVTVVRRSLPQCHPWPHRF